MWPKDEQILRFGVLTLDLNSHEVIVNGKRIHLSKLQFKLLNQLLEAQGAAVKNDNIIEYLWGNDPKGGPEALKSLIMELRSKLEDKEDKEIVETVSGVGYRISRKVCDDPVMGGIGIPAKRKSESDQLVLAVLPFIALDEKISQLDEMTVDMIRRFRRLAQGRFDVKDFQAVRGFSFKAKTDEQVGLELGVTYTFRAEVSRGEAGLLHLSEHLVRTTDAKQIWSGTDDIRGDQMVPLQSELALAVAETVRMPPLGDALLDELAAKQGVNLDARHLYREGRLCLEKRTQPAMEEAGRHFQEAINAIESDPSYARAFARLADAYLLRGLAGFPGDNHAKMADCARAYADRALEINDGLAEALAARATIYFRFDWDWQGAKVAFKDAIAADPNYPTAHHWYAIYLNCMRRHEDAKKELARARNLSDRSAIIFADSAWPFYNLKEYAEAIDRCDKALEIAPGFWLAHAICGLALHELGRYNEAIAQYTAALQNSPDDPRLLARMASACAKCNRLDDARRALSQLERLLDEGRKSHYFMATAYAGLDQVDKAMHSLTAAFDEKSPSCVFADLDPGLKNLRSVPEFEKLVGRLGKPAPP